jgi:predicted RNase H-like HicB family nuclease
MKYRILIEQDEDGMFVAECPALPGCLSQGKTRSEAIENIQDAIKGYLESLKKHNEPIPPHPISSSFFYMQEKISDTELYFLKVAIL